MGTPERFVFLLIPDFTHLAFACALEPLRIANLVAGRELYRWRLISEDGTRAVCSNGTVTLADGGLEPCDRHDRLFVISGQGVRGHATRPVLDYVRRERRRGVAVGAICSGAYVLARAGLLDGLPCAIHWEFHDSFLEEFPDVPLRRSVFVAEGPIPTASGGPAAADLMLHLIAEAHGAELAGQVADQMVYNAVRQEDAAQRLSIASRHGIRSETLKRVIRDMEAHTEDPIQTGALAARAGISMRQLERLFGKYLNCSPKKYYLDLRLEKARKLLMQTDMSLAEITVACGFVAPAHFARCYRTLFGTTPGTQRAIDRRPPASGGAAP